MCCFLAFLPFLSCCGSAAREAAGAAVGAVVAWPRGRGRCGGAFAAAGQGEEEEEEGGGGGGGGDRGGRAWWRWGSRMVDGALLPGRGKSGGNGAGEWDGVSSAFLASGS